METKKLLILIVDDEIGIRKYLGRLLESKGFLTEEASNGAQALDKIAAQRPDLIIMDGCMPEMTGMEAIRILKKNSETENIPILFSTGTHAEEARDGKLPINDYIVKPYGFGDLYEKIKKILRLK
jgi:two-component system response regulator MprA